MQWPSYEDALLFQQRAVAETGGFLGVLNPDRLEAALQRPLVVFGDFPFFPTAALKVAALIHSIITTHPFVDGNKRTAMRLGLAVMEATYRVRQEPSDESIETIALDVAEGLCDIPAIARWLESCYHS